MRVHPSLVMFSLCVSGPALSFAQVRIGGEQKVDVSTIGAALDASAAMRGSALGLQGNVNDTQPLFAQDDSPRGEHRYRARFYFAPGDFDPGEAQGHFRTRLFIGFEEEPGALSLKAGASGTLSWDEFESRRASAVGP